MNKFHILHKKNPPPKKQILMPQNININILYNKILTLENKIEDLSKKINNMTDTIDDMKNSSLSCITPKQRSLPTPTNSTINDFNRLMSDLYREDNEDYELV